MTNYTKPVKYYKKDASLAKKSSVSNDVFYKINTMYSITLNPPDKYQFFGDYNRIKKFRSFIHGKMLMFPGLYSLIIEVSEPRGFHTHCYSGPRLHCHGIVSFPTSKHLGRFLICFYYELQQWTGVDLDTCVDKHTWSEYCRKQRVIKQNLLSNIEPPMV